MDVLEKIETTLKERFKSAIPGMRGNWDDLIEESMIYIKKKALEEKDGRLAYHFDTQFLIQAVSECLRTDFALDGINYVIGGNRMYMPTYKAFKNKLYMVYPESVIDVGIVRDGDTINFSKESGSVLYQHNLANPFEDTPSRIIGAYCVIKNSRGEFLETLNQKDFEQMKDGSKMKQLWEKWESEFWKKSVIKRACKTHFNDITNDLEEKDNEVIGLAEVVKATDDKKAAIIEAAKAGKDDGNDTQNTAE